MQKFLRIILPTLIFFVGSAFILLYWIGVFLPFAAYPQWAKAAVLAAGWILFFFLLRYLWIRLFLPHWEMVCKRWLFHLLMAAGLAALTISLTLPFTPLYPADHLITIHSEDPIHFVKMTVNVRDAKWIVEPTEYEFTGEWVRGDHFSADHPGSSPAEIQFRNEFDVSDPAYYQFSFIRKEQPAEVEITINQETHHLQIPAAEKDSLEYSNMDVPMPSGDTISNAFGVWLAAFPAIRFVSLFLIFFLASVCIGCRKTGKLDQVLRYVLLFVLVYLLFHALHFQNEFINFWNQQPLFVLAAVVSLIWVPIGFNALAKRRPRLEGWIFVFIFVLAAGLRIYWVNQVPTAQVSDFGDFHRWALQLARGEPGLVMNYYFDFTRLLSLLYRIYPSDRTAVGMNIFFSLVTMAALVWICRETGHRQAGLTAAWVFAVLPSQFGMMGLVCTDIISTALLILCAAFLIRCIRHQKWYWLACAGFCLAAGFMIRGVLILYAPLFLLPLLFHGNITPAKLGKAILFSAAGFAAGVLLVKVAVIPARVDDMEFAEYKIATWTLLNGTNIEAKGRNNPADTRLVYEWTRREAFTEGVPLILDRIFSDPAAYYRFLKVKFNHFLANDAYGADLAFLGPDMNYQTFQTRWETPTPEVRRRYAQISQYSYWCLLAGAVAFVFRFRPSHRHIGWFCLSVLLLALAGFAFFEVQPRYHIPLMPFLVLLAALGLSPVSDEK